MTNQWNNPVKRTARKAGVGVVGVVTIALGIALIPLPGPGSLVILGGLTILGSEFPAARRLSDRTKKSARDMARRIRAR